MNDKILQKIRNVFTEFENIKMAILYGSGVTQDIRTINDIDIGVADAEKIDFDLLADIQLALEKALKKKVDLVDLNTINGPILQQILCKGEIVVCHDHALYAKLMKKMLYFQADMMPGYMMILKKRAEKFANG